MSNAETTHWDEHGARSQLRKPHIIMFCSLTIALFLAGLLGYTALQFSQATDRAREQYALAHDLSAEIVYRDEVRTNSALLAASTGDAGWLERYQNNVGPLDNALTQTRVLGSGGLFALDGLTQLDAANDDLLALEDEALGLVRQGRSSEAGELLRAEQYGEAKTSYSEGITTLTGDIANGISTAKAGDTRQAAVALSVAGAAALATLVLSVVAWRSLAAWRRKRVYAIVQFERTQRDQQTELSDLQVQLASLAQNSDVHWWQVDADGNFISTAGLNAGRAQLPGLEHMDLNERNVFKLMADYPDVLSAIRRALAGEITNDLFLVGDVAWQTVYLPKTRHGIIAGVMGVSTDVTTEWNLQLQAKHDSLTGLLNRSGFENAVDELLAGPTSRASLLLLDVSGLRTINDARGHDVGDRALTVIGARIANLAKDIGVAGRIGGDEFCVLLNDVEADEAVVLAERLVACATDPIADSTGTIKLRGAVGFDSGALHSRTFRGEMAALDIAFSHARTTHRSSARFHPTMMHDFADEIARIEELAEAIEQRQFHVAYQPIWDATSGRLTGAEALARWNHPERGPISPGEFVPRAEKAGLIKDLDKLIVEQACAQLGSWQHDLGLASLRLSMNLSAADLDDDELIGRIETLCAANGLDPSSLLFELTESTAMENLEVAQQRLDELRELGCQLALDDFGTGYSSLSHLQNLAVDELKIDRGFVSGEVSNRQEFSEMIVGLAKLLDLSVVAEGVETPDQLHAIRKLGCDYVQGFLLAKPMLAAEFKELLLDIGQGTHAAWDRDRQSV